MESPSGADMVTESIDDGGLRLYGCDAGLGLADLLLYKKKRPRRTWDLILCDYQDLHWLSHCYRAHRLACDYCACMPRVARQTTGQNTKVHRLPLSRTISLV